jgi:hypothetical protein
MWSEARTKQALCSTRWSPVGEEAGGPAGTRAASSSSKTWRGRTDQRGATGTRRELNIGEGEKNGGLTRRSRACSERLEEGRSDLISPVSREEEEAAPVTVVGIGSIPSWRTEMTTCRTAWSSRVCALVTTEAGRR